MKPRGMNRKEWAKVEERINLLTEVEKANLLIVWNDSNEKRESDKTVRRIGYAKYLVEQGIINEGLSGEIEDIPESRLAEFISQVVLGGQNEIE